MLSHAVYGAGSDKMYEKIGSEEKAFQSIC